MNESAKNVPTSPQRDINWTRRLVFIGVGVAAVVLAYLIGGQVIPREWADFIGRRVDRSFWAAVYLGLFNGIVFTFIPLLVLYIGFRKRRSWGAWLAFLIVALIVALPNLLTLGIVMGNGNPAHDAQRVFSTDAQYYRGWNLAGAIIGALLFMFAAWIMIRRHRLREREHAVKAERKALDDERSKQRQDTSQ
jgi:hypothetical protein